MLRHALAPVHASAAARLSLPRSLPSPGAAITFDDGPHPEGTPAMLDVLADHGAQATFFLVGEQVERRPALVREIRARGHEIALHGYRHRLQLRLTREELREDLARGVAVLEDAVGERPRLHRPPFGIYSAGGLEAVRTAGLRPLLWSRWGKDWRRFTTPARIARRATRDLHAGDVILLHDADFYSARRSHERTARALPAILATLHAQGLDTVLAV